MDRLQAIATGKAEELPASEKSTRSSENQENGSIKKRNMAKKTTKKVVADSTVEE